MLVTEGSLGAGKIGGYTFALSFDGSQSGTFDPTRGSLFPYATSVGIISRRLGRGHRHHSRQGVQHPITFGEFIGMIPLTIERREECMVTRLSVVVVLLEHGFVF
jgi:hypothetical protein